MSQYFDKSVDAIRKGSQPSSGFKKSVSPEAIALAKTSAQYKGPGMFQTLIRNAASSSIGAGETWSPTVNWMYGTSGKKLPKLPKGTKVGNLVMGDYGLYCPKIRAQQESLMALGEKGVPMYLRGKYDPLMMKGVWFVMFPAMVVTSLYCYSTIVLGKPPNEYFNIGKGK